MNHEAQPSPILPLSELDRVAWRAHNLETLRESAALSFEHKLQVLEDLEEVALAFGYQRNPLTGRLFHPEKSLPPGITLK